MGIKEEQSQTLFSEARHAPLLLLQFGLGLRGQGVSTREERRGGSGR